MTYNKSFAEESVKEIWVKRVVMSCWGNAYWHPASGSALKMVHVGTPLTPLTLQALTSLYSDDAVSRKTKFIPDKLNAQSNILK